MKRLQFAALALLAIAMLLQPARSLAEYPEQPIHLLVPFPPGGAVDIVARLVSAKMSAILGNQIVVENKAGAGGIIATEAVAKAAHDGYTLLLTTPNHTINGAMRARLPYNTQKDLTPISVLADVPEVLVSYPGAPYKTFAELVAYAKKNPGKINYASAGVGTLPHVTMELLAHRLGIELTQVPYRGAAPAMTDLLAGVVQLKLDTYATSHPYVVAGKLRMLAIASSHRSDLAPNLPTIAELGVPGYEGVLWIGMMAPSGTPQGVIDRLAATAQAAAKDPTLATRLRAQGVEPIGGTPAQFSDLITRELKQWRDLSKSAHITLQ